MILQACTTRTNGLAIDYKAINCAGWPEPVKVPRSTSRVVLDELYPVNTKLQDCLDYRQSIIKSVIK